MAEHLGQRQHGKCTIRDQPRKYEPGWTKKLRQRTYKRNNEIRTCNHCCRGKTTVITYYDCLSVALVIEKQSACTVLYCHLSPVLLYHIFHIRPNLYTARFSGKTYSTQDVFWFSTQILSKTFLVLRRIPGDMIINAKRLNGKWLLFLLDFN